MLSKASPTLLIGNVGDFTIQTYNPIAKYRNGCVL